MTSIGEGAFRFCSSLTSIKVEDGNSVFDSRDNCNAIIETQSNMLISGCKNSTIPNSVTSIGDYAFGGIGLTSVTIPHSVTSIGDGAFMGCSDLTSVTIPNSVTSIDDWAFDNCISLTSITIGNGVTYIGEYVFNNCSSLTDIYCCAEDVPNTKSNAFRNYNLTNATLHVPTGSIDAYKAVEPWSGFKEIVALSDESTDVDDITIKDIGKTTWCSKYDLDFTNVAGIKAYIAMGYDDNDKTIWLARVMKVPAGTGLLVKGDAGTYKIPHVNVRAYYTNMLVGNLGETIKIEETDGDKTNYYLSGKDGTFVSVNGNANIGKNKAYLQLPTSIFAGTRSIGISYDDEDGTTSIKGVKTGDMKSGEWYTLQGQRVVKPGKGLYIHNGKKVIIR